MSTGQRAGQLTYIDIAGVDVVSLTVTDIRQRLQNNAIVIICRRQKFNSHTGGSLQDSIINTHEFTYKQQYFQIY